MKNIEETDPLNKPKDREEQSETAATEVPKEEKKLIPPVDGIEVSDLVAHLPLSESSKEEAPKEETPKEDTPKADAPKEAKPEEDAPKDGKILIPPVDGIEVSDLVAHLPLSESSKEEAPKEETPKKDTPKADAPKEDVPKKAAPVKAVSPAGTSKPTTEVLIDDGEEKLINDSYDDAVDTEDTVDPELAEQAEQVEQKEDAEDKEENKATEKHEAEQVNYSLLSKEDLVKLLSERLDHPGRGNLRKDVEEIRSVFDEKASAALEEKRKNFLEEGGNLEDFKPAEEPAEAEIKELLYKYKGVKAEYTRQLETNKKQNLQKKQDILEELRILMESQENFELTFRKFKDLQKQWFAAGVVPHQNLKDLWDSYNYFVEKFNDYVRINRDLRALDLKKNLELKTQLCQRTEELDMEANAVQAFKVLQKNHARWREIGPVPRENRDEIWDRFKAATALINKKHQEYHSRLKESLHENLEKKIDLCTRIETIAARVYETHGAWVDKTKQVLEIQKTWKTIGYAPKKDNNIIYARFRQACDTFFGNKAKYYAAAFDEQKENLTLKISIAEKAETLSDSDDWKGTTVELIQLQKKWKEIGPVPRKESDKLWRRFRSACDAFFNKKSKYFENIDSTFDANLKLKEALLAEMEAFEISDDQKENLAAVKEFQSRFNAIGYVPAGKKEVIKEQFREAQDNFLEKTGMDESARSMLKFRYRVSGIAGGPRADMKLNFERDKLINKLQQLKSDMAVWENNIGFFKQSDSSSDTILGFQEKIDAAHERIKSMEQKIRLLDDMENGN